MDFLTALDNEILWLIRNNLSGNFFKQIWLSVYKVSFVGLLWFVLGIVLLIKGRRKYVGAAVISALAAAFIVSYAASRLIVRMPPYMADADIDLLVKTFGNKSLSYSTVMGFSAAVVLSRLWRQFGSIFILLAAFTAVSHLYLMLYYPTDIILSAILGIFTGCIIGKIALRLTPVRVKV